MSDSPPPTCASFALRVCASKRLRGFEVMAFFPAIGDPGPRDFEVRARHRYGPWQSFPVRQCSAGMCVSDRGAFLTAADVAVRLRRMLSDRGPRRANIEKL